MYGHSVRYNSGHKVLYEQQKVDTCAVWRHVTYGVYLLPLLTAVMTQVAVLLGGATRGIATGTL